MEKLTLHYREDGGNEFRLWNQDDNYPQDCSVAAMTDYAARANACVNALAGLNPDAVADVVKALEECLAVVNTHNVTDAKAAVAHVNARAALGKLRE